MLTKPTDPYDPVWPAYWAANPQQFRSVGSQAAEADDGAAEAEAAAAAEAKVAADAEAAEKVKADADAKTAADAKAAAAKAKKAGEADWRTAIEDEDHRKFAERFTGPGDAVKAAFDLRKQASERFEAPGKDATDEQRAEWRTRIGVPEAPGGYEVDVPEDTPEDVVPTAEDLTPFLAAMHEADAPPAAVQAAVDYFYGDYLKAGQESLEERQVEAEKANTKAIETEWPDEADRATNSQFALRASVHFGGPSFKKFVTETRVGGVLLADHLEFVRPFAKIGRRITEKGVQIGMSEEETKDQESKLDELTAEAHAADQAGDIKKRDRLFAERDKLSKETYGTEAVVGEEGRVL